MAKTIGPIEYGGLCVKNDISQFGQGAVSTGVWASIPTGMMSECFGFVKIYGALTPTPLASVMCNQLGGLAIGVYGVTSWIDTANYSQGATIFGLSDGKIYSGPWQYNRSTPITFTNVTGTATVSANTPTMWASLNNVLVGVQTVGNTAPWKITAYNGTASDLGGGAPNGGVVKTVNNFMFIGRQLGASSTYSRVSWSNVVDPQTWTASNFVDFNKNDGDRVVGLGAIGTDLYIFKSNSIGRLSTQTLTVSGSVTLGPLQTVVNGIGLLGSTCIDNLPDGRIVFLSADAKLYIFDGYSFQNISDATSPNATIQTLLDELGGYFDPRFIVLKVYPQRGWILISGGDGANVGRMYAYDYLEKFWTKLPWGSYSLATVLPQDIQTNTIAGYFNNRIALISGTSNGYIAQLDNNSTFYGPTDESGGQSQPYCTINVQLSGDYYGFIPRSIVLPMSNMGSTSQGGVQVQIGYDGVIASSYPFTLPAAPFPPKQVIKLPIRNENGFNTKPLTMQIKLYGSYQGPVFHPFYVSDEVLS